MNTNNNSPRLVAPKVSFPGKESLLKPVVHRSAIWVKVASVAASLILIITGSIMFWPSDQSPARETQQPNTFSQALFQEPSSPIVQQTTQQPYVAQQNQITEKSTQRTVHKKAIATPQKRFKKEILATKNTDVKSIQKQVEKLTATIIDPIIITVNVRSKVNTIGTKVPQNHTAFNLPKFRTVTVFEDIKKSIIEQVQEAPLGQIIISARNKMVQKDEEYDETTYQDDYIL